MKCMLFADVYKLYMIAKTIYSLQTSQLSYTKENIKRRNKFLLGQIVYKYREHYTLRDTIYIVLQQHNMKSVINASHTYSHYRSMCTWYNICILYSY